MCLKYGFDASRKPYVPNITNQAVYFGINLTSHTQTSKYSSTENHSAPLLKQRHVFDLGAISPVKNFLVLSSERRLNEERVWKQVFWLFDVSLRWSDRFGKHEANCDPILETHSAQSRPLSSLMKQPGGKKIHAAALNKTSDTLTQ